MYVYFHSCHRILEFWLLLRLQLSESGFSFLRSSIGLIDWKNSFNHILSLFTKLRRSPLPTELSRDP